jgi:hypothetical protein
VRAFATDVGHDYFMIFLEFWPHSTLGHWLLRLPYFFVSTMNRMLTPSQTQNHQQGAQEGRRVQEIRNDKDVAQLLQRAVEICLEEY